MAFVKVKWNIKKGYWFFERIRLEHSHPLRPSSSLTQYMKAHKEKDPTIMGIVDQMHMCDVSLNATVHVLSDIYGGRQNFTFTEGPEKQVMYTVMYNQMILIVKSVMGVA